MTATRSAPPVRLDSASTGNHTLQERWIHLLARASAAGAEEPAISPYLRHLLDHLTPFGATVLLALRDGPGGAQTMEAYRPGGTPWHYLGPTRKALAVRMRREDDDRLALTLDDLVGLGVVRRDDAHYTLSPIGVRLLIACGAAA